MDENKPSATSQPAAIPAQGFGQLWQKTYRLPLTGAAITPPAVIAAWQADPAAFWPAGPFQASDLRLIYSDRTSFSFQFLPGHPYAGSVICSAFEEGGTCVVQIQALERARDPLVELRLRFAHGDREEDDFWQASLRKLANHFGVQGETAVKKVCVDRKRRWSEIGSLRHDSTTNSPRSFAARLLGRT